MSRLERHALLVNLIDRMRAAESWTGRTHIQKTLYVFQTLFAPEAGLLVPYILYRHGPYSFALDEDLAEMEFYGAIRREEHPPYGPRYAVTSEGRELPARFGQGLDAWVPAVQFLAARVGTKSVRELEALCTLAYVLRKAADGSDGPPAPLDRLRALKPHLTEDEVRRAEAEYDRLVEETRAITGARKG